ncbi:hypothetical protein ACEWX3_07695 [Mycobacterium sp. G7A2]|uniref:hypothetical protein n=1 Tax=Mycobacterium sp. G7A2 TaxID=3317307 RepID=UPI0035A8ED20
MPRKNLAERMRAAQLGLDLARHRQDEVLVGFYTRELDRLLDAHLDGVELEDIPVLPTPPVPRTHRLNDA